MSAVPPIEPTPPAEVPVVPVGAAAPPPALPSRRDRVVLPRAVVYSILLLSGLALATSGLLWQKLSTIQEQLARQSADSGANAIEARALAREAQELARDTAARQAVIESRVAEVSLQRTQIEELMQSLSRSRDENLLVDVEAALRLAQQQSQLTLSVEPLLAALRTADQRLALAGQPGLARIRAAISRDLDRIKRASVADVPALLLKMDDLIRQVDELPVVNAPPQANAAARREAPLPEGEGPWWQRALGVVREEARGLVRVSRIDQPDAVLLAPEHSFFLRENLKLKLLNARLGLLARQTASARSDVAAATNALNRYFDPGSRRTQAAATLLQQVQAQLRTVDLPPIDETLAVLATANGAR